MKRISLFLVVIALNAFAVTSAEVEKKLGQYGQCDG